MLDTNTKRRIDSARDILVGKVPDPKSQVEQITMALIYKFMDDMDREAVELGGKRTFFSGEYEKFAWHKIFAPQMGGEAVLKLYMEALEKLNINPNVPQLFRDIFKNAYLPYRDPETLKSFLKIIDEFTYDHSEKLGDAFEYLLSVLGSQGSAGQFRTPRHIIDLMVDIMDPKKNETILDPACGTAGFLISSFKHILKHNSSNFNPKEEKLITNEEVSSLNELTLNNKKYRGDKLTPDERSELAKNISGYDISPDMVRLSLVNMYLHGLNDPAISEYDTLTSQDNWNQYFDVILANPPFMSPKGGIRPHNRFTITSSRSEVLFVDYMAEHLTPNGRAAIIVPEGIIFQSGNAYKQLRKLLVDENLVGVISLPAGVFNPYSGVKTSILWLDKALAKKTDNILFIKIENDGFDLGAQRRAIKQNDLPLVKSVVAAYKTALDAEVIFSSDTFSDYPLVKKSKIAENGDYNLSGERYETVSIINSVWPTYKLGELCNFSQGIQVDKPLQLNSSKVGYEKFLRIENYTQLSDDFRYIPKKLSKDKFVYSDDVVVVRYGASAGFIGKGFEGVLANNLFKISPVKNDLLKSFLYHCLNSEISQTYFKKSTAGGAMPALSFGIVKDFQIPLPPLSVQEEIVAEIEGYQKIIDGARQVVENYKPHIKIDPDWEMVELGKVTIIVSGYGFDSNDFSTENPVNCIKITNVGVREFIEDLESKLPLDHATQYKNYSVNEGDIVISLTRSIISTGLKVAIVSKSFDGALVNQRVAAVKGIDNLSNVKFIYYYLCSPIVYDYVLNKSRSLMQPNLSITDLKKLQIPKPDLNTQIKIVGQIEKEQEMINGNKQLIKIYEQKIKDRIGEVWGE